MMRVLIYFELKPKKLMTVKFLHKFYINSNFFYLCTRPKFQFFFSLSRIGECFKVCNFEIPAKYH